MATINYIALKNEILNDPAGLGYAGMATDIAVAQAMNAKTQPYTLSSLSGKEILELTDWSVNGGYRDDTVMTGTKRLEWLMFTSQEIIDLDKSAAMIVRSIFGGTAGSPSVTESNIRAAASIFVSRVSQLDLGVSVVADGEITVARTK